jgi:hypothetical protein
MGMGLKEREEVDRGAVYKSGAMAIHGVEVMSL